MERERSQSEQEASNARRGRAAQRRRGGAARGALGRRSRHVSSPTSSARSSVYEVLDEEGLALIEANADTVLEEIGIEFRDDRGGAGNCGRRPAPTSRASACIFRKGLPRSLLKTAPSIYTQHARNPERSVRSAATPRCSRRSTARPSCATSTASRRYAHDRGFPQFREARLHGAVDPPFRRHGVRAGRRAGQQAPPRHGLHATSAIPTSRSWARSRRRSAPRTRWRWPRSCSATTSSRTTRVLTSLINANSPMVFDETMLGALKVYARAQPGAASSRRSSWPAR